MALYDPNKYHIKPHRCYCIPVWINVMSCIYCVFGASAVIMMQGFSTNPPNLCCPNLIGLYGSTSIPDIKPIHAMWHPVFIILKYVFMKKYVWTYFQPNLRAFKLIEAKQYPLHKQK